MGRRGHDVLRELVGGLSKPVALAMVAMSIAFALNFLELSSALEDVGWALVQFMFILAAMWLIFTLVDLVSCVTRKVAGTFGTAYDEMAAILMRRTLRTATFIFVVIFLLQNILGIRVTALLAGVGLAGLALSLAGHGFFRNAFGALSIFVNKPFLVGDWIHFEEEYGVVEDVGLYATKIRWLHGELATVPNMRFIDARVDNLSERKFLRRAMNIAVRYDMKAADMRKAVGIVRDVLHDEELADEGKYGPDKRVPHVTFSHYGPDHLNIRAYYWYYIGDDGEALQRNSDRGWYSFLEHCEQVNTKLKAAFDEAGIDFAFPTETHRVESVDDRPAEFTVKANRAGSQETK
jgi:MscS family membrane protein